MTNAQLLPAILIPLILWRCYRRLRRHIGRQHFRPTRMLVSTSVMILVLGLVGYSLIHLPPALAALGSGAGAGLILGYLGYRLTEFEVSSEGKYYTPNGYLGAAIATVLIGRVIYRAMILFSSTEVVPSAAPSLGQSPLTALLLGLTFGYYIMFNVLVTKRMATT